MKIVTLTLSPAFDRFCQIDRLKPNRENLVQETFQAAGGKGINISRALHIAGISSVAVAVLGRENGAEFAAEVTGQGIELIALWQQGRIRENITITTLTGETRISFDAAEMEQKMLADMFESLQIAAGDILVVAGRLPPGITTLDILPFLKELRCKGVLLVIDSKSFSLKQLQDVAPWLIKPNEEEITQYYVGAVDSRNEALEAARELHKCGIENVMISLGAEGAVLVNAEGAFSCASPELAVRSTVGAGDNAIAGFLSAHCLGLSSAEKLKNAVAFGSAACLTDGPLPPDMPTIQQIYQKLKIQQH